MHDNRTLTSSDPQFVIRKCLNGYEVNILSYPEANSGICCGDPRTRSCRPSCMARSKGKEGLEIN